MQEQHTGHTAVAYVIASIARVGVFILFRVKLVSAHRRPATPSESRAGSHNFMHNGFVYTVFTELQRTVALDTAFCCNILPRASQEVSYAFCIRNPPCFDILPDLESEWDLLNSNLVSPALSWSRSGLRKKWLVS